MPDNPAVPFPGRVLKVGDPGSDLVKLVQHQLNQRGCGPLAEDGVFDEDNTEPALKLFQMRFADVTGRPLTVDGKIGSLTWGALFGAESIPSSAEAPSKLTSAAVEFALTQVGVMENPLGSNRGPQVDQYLRAVGLDPADGSFAWCVAFTHFCYLQASAKLQIANPHIKTAGALDHWNKAGAKAGVVRITTDQAEADPGRVKPGMLFILDHGKGAGHAGMVLEAANGRLITIEGNTNDGGSREGIGVFKRNGRKISDINKGFIDYSGF